MHSEVLPEIRAAMRLRERLVPYLYSLLYRAHAEHEPVLKPLFLQWPADAACYAEEDAFLSDRACWSRRCSTKAADAHSLSAGDARWLVRFLDGGALSRRCLRHRRRAARPLPGLRRRRHPAAAPDRSTPRRRAI